MKRMRYEPQVKASIIAAFQEARKIGKTWAEALVAAQEAGYKGNVGGLTQFVTANKAKKTIAPQTVAPEASAPKASKVKKARRKAKRAVVAQAAKAPIAKPTSGQLDITALVHKTVTDAVVNALEGLLMTLKGGK